MTICVRSNFSMLCNICQGMILFSISIGVLLFGPLLQESSAQFDFEKEPISYSSPSTQNAVEKLCLQIEKGKISLKYDERFGYLKSVLNALNVSPSSQMLVFSKTSMQQRRISPSSPRAIYFNDDTYIGWVPKGKIIELSSVDPQKGAVFYTLRQEQAQRPELLRSRGNCLTCHASSRTHNIPGHLVRSVYPSETGMPHFGAGAFLTNHTSPLKERWGGWFVTGTHGKQRHMGNEIAIRKNRRESLDMDKGANVTDLSSRTPIKKYLTGHSDIVALMVLEHQTEMHNLITVANYDTRSAFHYDTIMNRALKRPANHVSTTTMSRMKSSAEKLVKYMLFAEETPLTATIQGTSNFAKEFEGRGPKDDQGRSLRQFDLKKRMFKYPCSYLVYSEAFRGLPQQLKEQVYRKLWEVLTKKEESKEDYARLSSTDRKAIYEILLQTKEGLPEYWKVKK